MSDLRSCTTKLGEPRVLYMCCAASAIARVDGVIYSTDLIFLSSCSRVLYVFSPYEVIRRMTCSIQDEHVIGCDVSTFCHTCAFHMSNMRGKDTLHSNRGCLRLDTVHAAA
jgi:hypothetical protein